MYENGDYYTEIAPYDELDINRFSASLAYQKVLSKSTVLNTTLYGYNTTRFWKRQNFSRNSNISDGTGVVFGDTTVNNGAIYMRNGTGNRDREFNVIGIQPSVISEGEVFGLMNKFNAGIRLHYERASEQRINGSKATAESGSLRNDEIRTGSAISAFIHDRIYLNDNLVVSPGVRYEHFEYEREIFRINYNDTLITSNNNINSFIPGIGLNYSFGNYTLFGGVHRGFAPPRIKDAITNEGEALELDAELSWNYELGLRSQPFSFLSFETTVYLMDFENQIIPVSESSGGMGAGLVNGGETIHRGVELSSTFDLSTLTGINDRFTMSANFSYNDSYYSSDRFIEQGDERINIKDNQLPYAPNYSFSAIANYELDFGLGMNVTLNYIDERFTDELNTISPTNDGLSGIIDSYYTLDATISYLIKSYDIRAFLSVKNLTDERYIASRRPQGIRVGLPRFISFGINYDL
jgi:Fe(3+) dicitrate transport protein